jgi:hypothetical protein
MGCYVNPDTEGKEAFLTREGRRVSMADAGLADFVTEFPVCLVDNGPFKAAGVGFDYREYEAFANPDGRKKVWYIVSVDKLKDVSDIESYV